MNEFNSLVPVVTDAIFAVSENLTGIITETKATGTIQRTKLNMLKNQTKKILADAKAHLVGELVITSLEQLAKTQEYIDFLASKGQLHGLSLDMAMDQMTDLNKMLRRNLQDFINGVSI